jgi:phage terminase large subunit-like protein
MQGFLNSLDAMTETDEIQKMGVVDVLALAQPGKQRAFLESAADWVFYGGAAGGGKTYGLLLDPLKDIDKLGFGAVIFRRERPSITVEGGMWDNSQFYSDFGGEPRKGDLSWTFPSGSRISFRGLQYEDDKLKYKGAQIPDLLFDQVEEFSESQFFYLASRNRSVSGVPGRMRATANPQPGWLADFLDWWIAPDGYADLDRAGEIRWFIRDENDQIVWGDTKDELIVNGDELPISVTFIPATVYDNKILLESDPGYIANLQAMSRIDRERLLGDRERGGNWKVKPEAGLIYNRANYELVPYAPEGGQEVLYWDLAATKADYKSGQKPSWTAGVLMRKVNGEFYIRHVYCERLPPGQVEKKFIEISVRFAKLSIADKTDFMVCWEQEPGSAGKRESFRLSKLLEGIATKADKVTRDKFIRGRAFASKSEAGLVHVVNAAWTELWLDHMHNQPDIPDMDIHDATTGAFNMLSNMLTTIKQIQSYQG